MLALTLECFYNAAERSLYSMVIGRKNFHFVGSEDAGK